MKNLEKEEYEKLCHQASEFRELFSYSRFDDNFNLPSESQKKLVKRYRKDIAREGIIYSFLAIFCGILALSLFSAPFQMKDEIVIHSFIDALYELLFFGILYGIGFLSFYVFYDRFISYKSRYLKKCLKNGNFTTQECTPIGYAEYGTRADSTDLVGNKRLFVVLKDNNQKIYVFESDYISFVKNVTKAENAFIIKVDNTGKKKETEIFLICY